MGADAVLTLLTILLAVGAMGHKFIRRRLARAWASRESDEPEEEDDPATAWQPAPAPKRLAHSVWQPAPITTGLGRATSSVEKATQTVETTPLLLGNTAPTVPITGSAETTPTALESAETGGKIAALEEKRRLELQIAYLIGRGESKSAMAKLLKWEGRKYKAFGDIFAAVLAELEALAALEGEDDQG